MALTYNKQTRTMDIRGVITLSNGNQISIGAKDILAYSISESSGGDGIALGSAEAASYTLTISNIGKGYTPAQFDNAEVHMEVGIKTDSDFVYSDFGVWYVCEANAPEQSVSIDLNGYDALATLFEVDYADTKSVYPTTLGSLATTMCAAAGISLKSNAFRNADVQVSQMPEWEEDITLRKIVGYISACAGGFARIDRAGKLEIVSYADGTAYAINSDLYTSLTRTNGSQFNFLALEVANPDSEDEEYTRYTPSPNVASSPTNTIRIDSNPLINAGIANSIVKILLNFSAVSATVSWCGDPAVTIGDKLNITDTAGNSISVLVASQEISFTGGLSCTSSCSLPSSNSVNSGSYTSSGNIIDGNGKIKATRISNLDKSIVSATTGYFNSLTAETVKTDKLMASFVDAINLLAAVINAEVLKANSITSDKLAAGSVTADTIAAGAITSDKIAAGVIEAANIDAIAAKIESLTAEDITTDRLAAALAAFTVVTAGTAAFDKATVSHLVANLFNLTGSGVMDDVFIHNLKIAYAQMVSASIGNLVLQASNGEYYQIDVDQDGSVSATLVEPSAEEIASGVFGQTRPILATSMTVDDMNASSIKAVHMLINKIDAARIDVDQLFARQAFITQLTTRNIIGGKSLTIIAGEAEGAASAAKNAVKTYRQESAPDVADGVRNGDLWIKPSTGAIYQADAIEFVLDENGDLYLNHGSDDGHSARFASGDPTMLEASFSVTLGIDGEIISMPVTWMLVQDQTLLNEITDNATWKVDVEYALSDSNTDAPTTGWKTTAPKQTEDMYIWSRTVTYFRDDSKSIGAASCLSTSLGKSIANIEEEYALGANAETAPEDGWQTDVVPTPTSDKPYIWTRSKITYVDGYVTYAGTQVQAKHYADILTENLLDKTDGKTTVYYQDTQPTGSGIQKGDLWYDTDSSSETIYRYNGSEWVENTSDTALTRALGALKMASTAKAIADSKIVTFAQDEAPTSGMNEGDLWIDTNDNNKLHRYELTKEGTYNWVKYADTSYVDAVNANKIYSGDDAPENPTDGMVWVDTGTPGNPMKRYSADEKKWIIITDLTVINKIAEELKKQQNEMQDAINNLATAITLDSRGAHFYKPDYKDKNEVIIDQDSVDIVVNGDVYSSFIPKGLVLGDYMLWQPNSAGGLAFSLKKE